MPKHAKKENMMAEDGRKTDRPTVRHKPTH